MATVISVCSQKGGVSKTSTTIELATVLKLKGRRVLVVDYDQQCSLSKNVSADLKSGTIYDVLHADVPVKNAIQRLELFDIIPASESLSRADREFIEDDDVFLLVDILDIVKDDYDYIFVDNAPSRNKLLTMSYIASDYIVIPTECDESSLDGLVTTEKDVDKLVNGRHRDSHAKILGYILTKNENTLMHQLAYDTLCELANNNPDKPFVMKVRKSIKVSEVKTFHTAASKLYGPKSQQVVKDYYNIVNVILARLESEEVFANAKKDSRVKIKKMGSGSDSVSYLVSPSDGYMLRDGSECVRVKTVADILSILDSEIIEVN